MIGASFAILVAPAAPLEVEWEAPQGCPSGADVRAAVERALVETDDGERASIRAVGKVESTETGYRLRLEVDDGSTTSERALEGVTCSEVTDAAALILAMAIDPRVSSTEEAPAPTVPEPKVVEAESAGDTEPPPTTERVDTIPPARPRPRFHFVGRVMAGLGLGPLPAPSASISAAVGIGGRLWRAEAVGHFWPAVEGDAPRDSTRTAIASLWAVGARGCVVPEVRRAAFPVCAGFDAGAMQANAERGVVVQAPKTTPWAAVVLGAGAEWWPIRHVGLGARVDGHATAYRPEFVTSPSGRTVHRPAVVGLQLLGGLLVRAP